MYSTLKEWHDQGVGLANILQMVRQIWMPQTREEIKFEKEELAERWRLATRPSMYEWKPPKEG
jgi:hypothetical protein